MKIQNYYIPFLRQGFPHGKRVYAFQFSREPISTQGDGILTSYVANSIGRDLIVCAIWFAFGQMASELFRSFIGFTNSTVRNLHPLKFFRIFKVSSDHAGHTDWISVMGAERLKLSFAPKKICGRRIGYRS